MTRHARAAVAVWAAALAVAGLGAAATYSTYVVLRPFEAPALVWLGFWSLAILGVLLYVPSRVALVAGAVPFVAVALFTGLWAAVGSSAMSDERVVRRLDAPGHEIRVVSGQHVVDRVVEVRVRTKAGLLSREWVVWRAELYDTPAVTVTGPRSLRIESRYGVDAVTF